ncbi:phage protein NinX family protein [Burkholderia ubonensis]|uniref:DUF2591 domain-containing protein n=1 Tax=Burkholderia ubonensis TaxID=101571 RepID=A0ABD4DZA9_9BURK|nr:phage protein NinX family protein [Burkholderia ubonensis]KVN83444.1 hypothetical protein WJ68_16150 [Burkholderia ubonensis]
MKVSELQDDLLDHWVAKADDTPIKRHKDGFLYTDEAHFRQWDPSSNWLIAGPIIERARIELFPTSGTAWRARTSDDAEWHYGPSPRIAAMRAYVASKFGEEVPDEGV